MVVLQWSVWVAIMELTYEQLLICSEIRMALAQDLDVCEVAAVDPERVRRVMRKLTDEDTAERLAETFATLSDTTRLRIVEALSHEELCVCDLSAALNLSQSAASHHLRTLRNLRLVKHR